MTTSIGCLKSQNRVLSKSEPMGFTISDYSHGKEVYMAAERHVRRQAAKHEALAREVDRFNGQTAKCCAVWLWLVMKWMNVKAKPSSFLLPSPPTRIRSIDTHRHRDTLKGTAWRSPQCASPLSPTSLDILLLNSLFHLFIFSQGSDPRFLR